jgi:hypothetical protein
MYSYNSPPRFLSPPLSKHIPTKGSSVEEGVALFRIYRSKYNRTTYFNASTEVFIRAQICVNVWDISRWMTQWAVFDMSFSWEDFRFLRQFL